MSLYANLPRASAKIDLRHTHYRFDLETDVPWSLVNEPGDYFNVGLLTDLGLDATRLGSRPEAWELFQWGAALATCRSFGALERHIVRVLDRDRRELFASRSVENLWEEEIKHVALFQRYEEHLLELHPDWSPRFDQLFQACARVQRPREGEGPKSPSEHYLFWLVTLFFEEYTVYFHERLREGAGRVQPAWLAAHALHRREEIQHLVTDRELLASMDIAPHDRALWSTLFFASLHRDWRLLTGVDAACRLLAEAHPDLTGVERRGPQPTDEFFEVIRTHASFSQTRALPGFLKRVSQAD